MKKVYIAFLLWLLFGGVCFGFTPPAGCDADSWMLHRNSSDMVTVYFFKMDEYGMYSYACDANLGTFAGGVIAGGGGVGSASLDTAGLSSIVSFFAGNLALMAFIAGFWGGKS